MWLCLDLNHSCNDVRALSYQLGLCVERYEPFTILLIGQKHIGKVFNILYVYRNILVSLRFIPWICSNCMLEPCHRNFKAVKAHHLLQFSCHIVATLCGPTSGVAFAGSPHPDRPPAHAAYGCQLMVTHCLILL